MEHRKVYWLIELLQRNGENAMWLSAKDSTNEYAVTGLFHWTGDANRAIRFGRRVDANSFIGAMSRLMDELPHRCIVPHLATDSDREIKVTDHTWIDDNWSN